MSTVLEPEEKVAELEEAHERALWFLEARGYRRCDIAACNCPYWHGGHAEQRLTEIGDAIEHNGKTILQAVEECVAENATLRAQLEQLQKNFETLNTDFETSNKYCEEHHVDAGENY